MILLNKQNKFNNENNCQICLSSSPLHSTCIMHTVYTWWECLVFMLTLQCVWWDRKKTTSWSSPCSGDALLSALTHMFTKQTQQYTHTHTHLNAHRHKYTQIIWQEKLWHVMYAGTALKCMSPSVYLCQSLCPSCSRASLIPGNHHQAKLWARRASIVGILAACSGLVQGM